MSICNLAIMGKYLSKHNVPFAVINQFCGEIEALLEQAVKSKDDKELFVYLEKCKKPYGRYFNNCLIGMKEYINSLDFNFPGKHFSKSFFWGGIRRVYESPFLSLLNERLDACIASHLSESYPSLPNIIKYTFSFSYQMLGAGIKYVTRNPFKAGAVFFYFQSTTFVSAIKTVEVCPNTYNNALIVSKCPLFDQIYTSFYVYQNVPIDEAKIFILGETHGENISDIATPHRLLYQDFVHAFGSAKDYILFESTKYNNESNPLKPAMTFPCSTVGYHNDFTCTGWEMDWQYFSELHDLNVGNETLSRMYLQVSEECIQKIDMLASTINQQNNPNQNSKIREKIDNLAKKASFFQTKAKTATKVVQELKPKVVKGRNDKNLIPTLKALKNKKFKKFLICGINHAAPEPKSDADLKPKKIGKNDLQNSLRKYLSDKPHVILYPRPR